jgi:hypothetical protein
MVPRQQLPGDTAVILPEGPAWAAEDLAAAAAVS